MSTKDESSSNSSSSGKVKEEKDNKTARAQNIDKNANKSSSESSNEDEHSERQKKTKDEKSAKKAESENSESEKSDKKFEREKSDKKSKIPTTRDGVKTKTTTKKKHKNAGKDSLAPDVTVDIPKPQGKLEPKVAAEGKVWVGTDDAPQSKEVPIKKMTVKYLAKLFKMRHIKYLVSMDHERIIPDGNGSFAKNIKYGSYYFVDGIYEGWDRCLRCRKEFQIGAKTTCKYHFGERLLFEKPKKSKIKKKKDEKILTKKDIEKERPVEKWSCCFKEELFSSGCTKTKGHLGMLDSGLQHLPPLGEEPLNPQFDPKANSSKRKKWRKKLEKLPHHKPPKEAPILQTVGALPPAAKREDVKEMEKIVREASGARQKVVFSLERSQETSSSTPSLSLSFDDIIVDQKEPLVRERQEDEKNKELKKSASLSSSPIPNKHSDTKNDTPQNGSHPEISVNENAESQRCEPIGATTEENKKPNDKIVSLSATNANTIEANEKITKEKTNLSSTDSTLTTETPKSSERTAVTKETNTEVTESPSKPKKSAGVSSTKHRKRNGDKNRATTAPDTTKQTGESLEKEPHNQ
jgi:hypothetical protein